MLGWSKATRNAVAAMSCLAQAHAEGRRVSSAEIARERGIPKPFVAKLLTTLSGAGLVTSVPGPGGGFVLARQPQTITLWDVAVLFERTMESMCPFGPDWCGNQEPCPMHGALKGMVEQIRRVMTETTFAVFCAAETVAVPSPM